LIFATLVGFTTPFVFAQQPQVKPACARPEFPLFEPLVGSWDVEWTNRVSPGKYLISKAISTIDRDPIGCMLTEHFLGERGGEPFTVLMLMNFRRAEKLERMLIDSGHGQMLFFEGSKNDAAVRFEWQRDLGTRRVMARHDYKDIRADSFSTVFSLSSDSGQTWEVVEQAKYRRSHSRVGRLLDEQ